MAKAILYYSLSGKVKAAAERMAAESGADLFEVRETRKRNAFTAFLPGCPQAAGRKRSAIMPLPEGADLERYDEVVIMGPIWAGKPAPAVNSAIALLPVGKAVSLVCLAGGKAGYSLDKTAELVTARGCTVKEARCVWAGEA
ncbi:MAG: hypothetical protein FWH32_07870 [Clostridiales bacterium]|nr:hypothetical protein [Clostridiales bacterium]